MEEICLVVGQSEAIAQYQFFIGLVAVVAVQGAALQQTECGSWAYAGGYALTCSEYHHKL